MRTRDLLVLALASFTLTACPSGGDGPKQPEALKGMTALKVDEIAEAKGRVTLAAGDLAITIPPGFAPFRFAGQTVYNGLGTGESVRVTAMSSPTPMDQARQKFVLEAAGTVASGAQRVTTSFGGKVGEPRFARTPWGMTAQFQTQGPFTRVSTQLIAVSARTMLMVQMDGQVGQGDPAGTAIKIIASLRPAGTPPPPLAKSDEVTVIDGLSDPPKGPPRLQAPPPEAPLPPTRPSPSGPR